MIRTRVGYTGGERNEPTYRRLGDHSEAIRITYDPERITYADLLEVFWDSHSPTWEPFSRQYRSAIFVANDEERTLAQASLLAHSAKLGQKLYTAIEPAGTFWTAEDYHQKYSLRSDPVVMASIAERYPDGSWVDSTAAARLNGILGGHAYRGELGDLGLAGESEARVRRFMDD